MTVEEAGVESGACINHPARRSVLRCGKCGGFICPQCVIQTPVGARCARCANLRRLPQFDVRPAMLARAGLAGLLASALGWVIISFVPFLSFFLSILVGVLVGEVMTRAANRRSNRLLEVVAVLDVVLGFAAVSPLRFANTNIDALMNVPQLLIGFLVPLAIASFVAVVKLR